MDSITIEIHIQNSHWTFNYQICHAGPLTLLYLIYMIQEMWSLLHILPYIWAKSPIFILNYFNYIHILFLF